MRVVFVTLAVYAAFLTSSVAHAGLPPPPSTVLPCPPCSEPPPPPTPVPTAGVGTLPQPTVTLTLDVKVTPQRVHRGHSLKLSVTSSPGDFVIATIHYRHEDPSSVTGTADDSGMFSKTWKVARDAPLGKGFVTVVIIQSPQPDKTTVSFTVIR